jgi:hypothetical protein
MKLFGENWRGCAKEQKTDGMSLGFVQNFDSRDRGIVYDGLKGEI